MDLTRRNVQTGTDMRRPGTQLYERSKFANEIGAAITMTPNAARILSHYEFDFACSMATSMEAVSGRP